MPLKYVQVAPWGWGARRGRGSSHRPETALQTSPPPQVEAPRRTSPDAQIEPDRQAIPSSQV